LKLVLIEWIDSAGMRGWNALGEVAGQREPMYCRSVGWVAYQDKRITTLVSSLSAEKNEGHEVGARGDITIPNQCITSRKVLVSP